MNTDGVGKPIGLPIWTSELISGPAEFKEYEFTPNIAISPGTKYFIGVDCGIYTSASCDLLISADYGENYDISDGNIWGNYGFGFISRKSANIATKIVMDSGSSSSNFRWHWKFNNVQEAVSLTDNVYLSATIYNDSTSTENLLCCASTNQITLDSVIGRNLTSYNFFFTTNFTGNEFLDLAPGESKTFNLGFLSPLSSGVIPGDFSIKGKILLNNNSDEMQADNFFSFTAGNTDLDSDGDELSDLDELLYGTNPNISDTDGDGILDGEEVVVGDDGFITNPLLLDSDDDGIYDNIEIFIGYNPSGDEDIDSDKDGLPDTWERLGFYYNNDTKVDIDLPDEGATVGKKDIFVWIDHMYKPPLTNSSQGTISFFQTDIDFEPSSVAIDAVEKAFEQRGIHLHFKYGGDDHRVKFDDEVSKTEFDNGLPTYREDKSIDTHERFEEIHSRVYRYILIGKKTYEKGSGLAKLPLLYPDNIEATFVNSEASLGSKNFKTTLMHELGHALGLGHGGPLCGEEMNTLIQEPTKVMAEESKEIPKKIKCDKDENPGDYRDYNELNQYHLNNKPNHLSVMNYLYQKGGLVARRTIINNGIKFLDKDGILDYASVPIENLDETISDGKTNLDDSVQVKTDEDSLFELPPPYGFPSNSSWPDDYMISFYKAARGPIKSVRSLESGRIGEEMKWTKISPEEIDINWSGRAGLVNGEGKTKLIVDTEWDKLIYKAFCIGQPYSADCVPWNSDGDSSNNASTLSEPSLTRYFSSYQYFLSLYKEGTRRLLSKPGKRLQLGAFLLNAGKENDTYLVDVKTDNGWAVETDTSVALDSGHNQVLSFFVNVPDDVNIGHKERIRIKAFSQGNTGLSEEISFFIIIKDTLPEDADSDNLSDDEEIAFGLDPANPDTDGDGVYDGVELIDVDNPEDGDRDGKIDAIDPDNFIFVDSDDDGLSDENEVSLGLNPYNPDTDDDGINDGVEVELRRPDSIPFDFDKDGIIDALEDGETAYDGIIHVDIDIKPASDENSINLGAKGVIPVAILSSYVFNATQDIKLESLTLAGVTVKTPGKSNKILCSSDDVNNDGLNDLVCQFENNLGIDIGDTTVLLEGMTVDNIPIRGADLVRIAPKS